MTPWPITWQRREPPLAAQAVVAQGPAAVALARRVLAEPTSLANMRCVAASQLLCLLAARENLPWVDNVQYLAPIPESPAIWIPTTLTATISGQAIARILAREQKSLPVALLPSPKLGFSLANAREVTPEMMQQWLGRQR